jgi:hypothetical protein
MTTNDLDAIRKLTAAADPGPWVAHDDGLVWTEAPIPGDPVSGSVELPNAEFIAAARTLVPALCDEIEQLRAEMERMRAVGADAHCDYGYPLGGMQPRIDWCGLRSGHSGWHYGGDRKFDNTGTVRRATAVAR